MARELQLMYAESEAPHQIGISHGDYLEDGLQTSMACTVSAMQPPH